MVKWAKELSELYREVSPKEFYRSIFPKGELDKKNEFTKGKYVGIACEFTNETKKDGHPLVKRYSITDDLDTIDELLESENFVIISPISYFGKERTTNHATRMYAFAIEIDNLKVREDGVPVGFNDLIHHFDIKLLPTPNYIVASGNGVHLYYVFENPLILHESVKRSLTRFKQAMTPYFWNRYVTFDYEREKMQFESAFQGFRMVGGVTKNGERTRVFEVSTHPVSVEYLNEFVREDDCEIESFYASDLSLAQAKEEYPEWYEKRIVQKQKKGTWICKRDLYDWWKRKIVNAEVGHRYNCLFVLAVYAIKCDISREELERDMYEFLEPYDELSNDDQNRFTVKDIADALQAYEDKGLITFPINSIIKRSGFLIEKNKRNYRTQEQHLAGARAIQEINDRFNGTNWREGNGRKSKKNIVEEWRKNNPNGKKIDCERETGLSRPTVLKWWK